LKNTKNQNKNCQGKDIKTTHVLNGYYHCATLTMMRNHVVYRPNLGTSRACLAQLVEHLICNQKVGGSNPSTGMGLWRETALMRNLSSQVHLMQRHAILTVGKNCHCDVVWMRMRLGQVMRDRAALISYISSLFSSAGRAMD
jgi:hypothetical protein